MADTPLVQVTDATGATRDVPSDWLDLYPGAFTKTDHQKSAERLARKADAEAEAAQEAARADVEQQAQAAEDAKSTGAKTAAATTDTKGK